MRRAGIALGILGGLALGVFLSLPGQSTASAGGGAIAYSSSQRFQLFGTSPQTFYVDSDGGKDSNACTAPGAAACATIQGACNKLAYGVCYPQTIQVSAGVFSSGGCYLNPHGMGACPGEVMIDAGPRIIIQGTAATAIVDAGIVTGTVTSATQSQQGNYFNSGTQNGFPGLDGGGWGTVTVSGGGWSVNNLAGDLFCITSGPGNGECGMVAQNTPTVATIAGGWDIALPVAGNTFQIQGVPLTTIDGGLVKPPGTLNYPSSYSAVYPAAFWVTGDVGVSWGSGYSSDFFNGAFVGVDSSWRDVPVLVQNFNFSMGDNGVDLSTSGDVGVAYRWNTHQVGIGVRPGNNSTAYVYSNRFFQDSFGDPEVYDQGYNNTSSFGFDFLYGNFTQLVNSGGFSSLLQTNRSALLLQNYTVQTDCGNTEAGLSYGSGSNTTMIGNFWQCLPVISNLTGNNGGVLTVDGDQAFDAGAAWSLQRGAMMTAVGDPISGTSVGIGVQVDGESQFSGPDQIVSSTADFRLGGVNTTFGQLGAICAGGTCSRITASGGFEQASVVFGAVQVGSPQVIATSAAGRIMGPDFFSLQSAGPPTVANTAGFTAGAAFAGAQISDAAGVIQFTGAVNAYAAGAQIWGITFATAKTRIPTVILECRAQNCAALWATVGAGGGPYATATAAGFNVFTPSAVTTAAVNYTFQYWVIE